MSGYSFLGKKVGEYWQWGSYEKEKGVLLAALQHTCTL